MTFVRFLASASCISTLDPDDARVRRSTDLINYPALECSLLLRAALSRMQLGARSILLFSYVRRTDGRRPLILTCSTPFNLSFPLSLSLSLSLSLLPQSIRNHLRDVSTILFSFSGRATHSGELSLTLEFVFLFLSRSVSLSFSFQVFFFPLFFFFALTSACRCL